MSVVHPGNAFSILGLIALPISTLISSVQFLKASSPTIFTDFGIVKLVRFLQPSKADFPIALVPLFIIRFINDSFPKNAFSPILVTASGISTVIILLHPLNVSDFISLTFLEI